MLNKVIMFLFITSIAFAKVGGGLMIGDPTGPTIKYYFARTLSVDAVIGYSFANALDIHSDVLKDIRLGRTINPINLYFGVGLKLRFYERKKNDIAEENDQDSAMMGVRFPIGVNLFWQRYNLEFFFEIAFILKLIPFGAAIDGGIGFRYYFYI